MSHDLAVIDAQARALIAEWQRLEKQTGVPAIYRAAVQMVTTLSRISHGYSRIAPAAPVTLNLDDKRVPL